MLSDPGPVLAYIGRFRAVAAASSSLRRCSATSTISSTAQRRSRDAASSASAPGSGLTGFVGIVLSYFFGPHQRPLVALIRGVAAILTHPTAIAGTVLCGIASILQRDPAPHSSRVKKAWAEDLHVPAPSARVVGTVIGRHPFPRAARTGRDVERLPRRAHRSSASSVAIKLLHDDYSRNPRRRRPLHRRGARRRARCAIPASSTSTTSATHEDGRAFLVMERSTARASRSRIVRDGACPSRSSSSISRQTARALAATHAAGIIHRDLKPANLFLVDRPTMPWGVLVKVLDFGVCRLVEDDKIRRRSPGAIVGTPHVHGARAVQERARRRRARRHLRARLHRLRDGDGPAAVHREGHGRDDARAHRSTAPPLAPARNVVSPTCCAIIARMLAKPPDARPQTMLAVEPALAAAAAERFERAPRSPAASPRRWKPSPTTPSSIDASSHSHQRRRNLLFILDSYAPLRAQHEEGSMLARRRTTFSTATRDESSSRCSAEK